jgi:hypothetical protein
MDETKRIMERLLKMPPKPHKDSGKRKQSPAKRTSGQGRARVGKAKN